MSSEVTHQTATDLASSIRAGDLRPSEVVEAHLNRIDEVNGDLNAIVSRRDRDEVMAEARAADDAEPVGILHGLPVAVKDLEDVAGLRTSAGSLVTSEEPAQRDGVVAQRLRAAGAIIVGKTNTPEFGTGSHTFNEVFGVTLNPWDRTRSAGGSSGGAAAALASRMLPIADGSDLGGSLRNPAAFCNVIGLRPGIGRVPDVLKGSTHLIRLGLSGPMGRTVADTALGLQALSGPHPGDPLSMLAEDFLAPLPTTTSARAAWGGDLGLFTCEAEVLSTCHDAISRIATVGGTVEPAFPDLSAAMDVFRVLRGLAYRNLGSAVPEDKHHLLKATVRENIAFGRTLDIEDVLRAERLRADIHATMASFFERFDVLALPAAQVAPFLAENEYPTEIDGVPMVDYLSWMTTCCVITPTSCPAISIPAGFTKAGLPVGLQLVAKVGAERALLEIASAIEAAHPFHQLVPA